MKIAILADIHANLEALEAVLTDIEGKGGVAEIWCLGDIVGYGPDPRPCIERVQKRCSACVAGNHDWAAAGKMETADFNPEAAEAAQWTRRQLKREDLRFLESLPFTLEKGDFTLVHGSPRDPLWEYILSAAEAEENLPYFPTRSCFVGHSHLPELFVCDDSCSAGVMTAGTEVKLGKKRWIINPGSVGQPRDNDPRASYAICDPEAGTMMLQRIPYDYPATQQKMREAELPAWLINRLAYGR